MQMQSIDCHEDYLMRLLSLEEMPNMLQGTVCRQSRLRVKLLKDRRGYSMTEAHQFEELTAALKVGWHAFGRQPVSMGRQYMPTPLTSASSVESRCDGIPPKRGASGPLVTNPKPVAGTC